MCRSRSQGSWVLLFSTERVSPRPATGNSTFVYPRGTRPALTPAMFAKPNCVPVLVAIALVTLSACRGRDKPERDKPEAAPVTSDSPATAPPTERVVGPLSPADSQALATMNDRVREYIDLHTKIESALPKLPVDATPQQIDKNQRAFERLMRNARATAKPGDIFTPEARPVITRLLDSVFGGAEGRQLKASIMDENPVGITLAVNGRYPDTVPLSTVPPQVLQTLPKLSEDMEYRFIGDRLILLDTHAHVIADFIEDALPK